MILTVPCHMNNVSYNCCANLSHPWNRLLEYFFFLYTVAWETTSAFHRWLWDFQKRFEIFNPAGPPWQFCFLCRHSFVLYVIHWLKYRWHWNSFMGVVKALSVGWIPQVKRKLLHAILKAIHLKWRPQLQFTAGALCVSWLHISRSMHIWIGRNLSCV